MSNILIDIVNKLIEYKLLPANIDIDAAREYIEGLSKDDQNILIGIVKKEEGVLKVK